MQKIKIISLAIFFAGCNTETKTDVKKETTTGNDTSSISNKNIADSSTSGCYQMIINKDTATLQINGRGEKYIGSLNYKRFQKDSNKGTVDLTKKDNKLRGWYSFQSEGTTSVREIEFKTMGDKVAEAYGDIGMRNDTAYYKYPAALMFEEKHPFNKVNCR
jgi:hypothetical protein